MPPSGIDNGVTSIVVNAPHASLRKTGPRLGSTRCPIDVVIWNAGAERARAIADLGDDDWRSYLCVEPGRVTAGTAALLQPGET